MTHPRDSSEPTTESSQQVTIVQRTPFWKLVLASLAALLLLALAIGAVASFSSRAEASVSDMGVWGAARACPDVIWVGARGSGQPPGMGDQVWTAYGGFKDRLERTVTRPIVTGFVELPYTAVGVGLYELVNDPTAYWPSRDNGVLNIDLMMAKIRDNCGSATQVVLAGYSQGADVVHMATNGQASTWGVSVRAVVLLSDPSKDPRDTSVVRRGNGWRWSGVMGGITSSPLPTISACVSGDIVCDFSGDIADLVAAEKVHGSKSYNGLAWGTGQWAADQVLPHLQKATTTPTTAVTAPAPTTATTTAPAVEEPKTPTGRLGVADTCRYDPLPCRGANLRRAAVYPGDIIGSMPQGHEFEIACQVHSTTITDSRGYSSTIWNKTSYEGLVGWVSDVWSGRKGWIGPDCIAPTPTTQPPTTTTTTPPPTTVTTQPPTTVTTQPPTTVTTQPPTTTTTLPPRERRVLWDTLSGRVHGQQNCSGTGAGAPMGRFVQTFKVPADVRVVDEVTIPLGNHDGADLAIYRGGTRLSRVHMPRNTQDGHWASFAIGPVDVTPGETLKLVVENFAAWNGTARGFNVYVLRDDVMPGVGYTVTNTCPYAQATEPGFASPMIVTGSTDRDWFGRIRGWNRR